MNEIEALSHAHDILARAAKSRMPTDLSKTMEAITRLVDDHGADISLRVEAQELLRAWQRGELIR